MRKKSLSAGNICTKYFAKALNGNMSLFLFVQFEINLCAAWDKAMEDGCFWYRIDGIKRKTLPGKYEMIAQVSLYRDTPEEKKNFILHFQFPTHFIIFYIRKLGLPYFQ